MWVISPGSRHLACVHTSLLSHSMPPVTNRVLDLGISTVGSVPSNIFTVVVGTLNTFDGTDPKVDRVKPKVQNTIIFPV